jgi:hypothetical protein
VQFVSEIHITQTKERLRTTELKILFFPFVNVNVVIVVVHQAILTEDGKLVLGDLRSKGGEEWSLTGKSITILTKDEKKILDLALLPGNT